MIFSLIFHSATVSKSINRTDSSNVANHVLFLCPSLLASGSDGVREVRHIVEIQEGRVDGEPEEGGRRSIEEDGSQMG